LSSTSVPVVAGLAIGIAFVVSFAMLMSDFPILRAPISLGDDDGVSIVIIPEGASNPNSGKDFEPQVVKVVVGANNTVRWVNHDVTPNWIEADSDDDPDFAAATSDFRFILPGESFEYTFTKAGEFGYHGRPYQRGTVIVLLPLDNTIPSLARLSQYDAIQIVEKDFKSRQSDYDRINGIIVNATSGYVKVEEFWFKNLELPLVYTHHNGTLFRITGNAYEDMGECDSGLVAYCGYLAPYNFDYKGRLVYGVEVLLSNEENLPEADYARGHPFLFIVDANSGEIVDSTFLRVEHIRD
jgi:plastocyanin